jgi:hypothetical protein
MRGRVDEHDEGETPIRIFTKDGTVFLDFGKQVAWIGLAKREAIELAKILIERAEAIKDH